MGGKKQTSDYCADGTGGLRRQVDEESRKGSGCCSDPERLVLLKYHCHAVILPLFHSSAVPALMRAPVKFVAHESWIVPIHGSLHILVDPATRGCGGNPRIG